MVCRSPAGILSSESLGSVSGARDEQKVKETSHLQKSCITHAPRWHPSLHCVGTNRQMIFGHSPDSVSKHRAVALPGFGNRSGSQTVGAIWSLYIPSLLDQAPLPCTGTPCTCDKPHQVTNEVTHRQKAYTLHVQPVSFGRVRYTKLPASVSVKLVLIKCGKCA